MNQKGGLISKLILIPLAIVGLVVILGGGAAIYFIGWDNVVGMFTTDEVAHNCSTENNTCLDLAIAGNWISHGCEQITLGGGILHFNSTAGKAVCVGSDVVLPEEKITPSQAVELAKKKIEFYCCDASTCVETETYYVVELAKYLEGEDTEGLFTLFKTDVQCIDAVSIEPSP